MIVSLGIAISLHKSTMYKYPWAQPYENNLEAHVSKNIRLLKKLKFISCPQFFKIFTAPI